MAGGASSSALRALREATQARHEVLDAGMPLARPDAGLRQYADHLRLLRVWLAPLEAWLARFHDGPQGREAPAPVARLPLLEADLADIDAEVNAAPRPAAPLNLIQRDWPPQASAAYRYGVSYVIEGSQLGGAVLYRRLSENLAPHPLYYLKGSLDALVPPGPRWQAFLKALDAQVQTPGQVEEACAGAADAFDHLLALLRANPALAAPRASDATGRSREAAA